MNNIKNISPILITGAERSGSTIIARILDMCDVWKGDCDKMFENKKLHTLQNNYFKNKTIPITDTLLLNMPLGWEISVLEALSQQGWTGGVWMNKSSLQARLWPFWHYAFPNAKWLIVRRRTGDVIQSCIKTGYMKLFKNTNNLKLVNASTEEEGWLWWVHQYEKKFIEMMQHGLNCRVIWPERMVDGDFSQIKETIEWLGLKWNRKIPEVVSPLLEKSRRAIEWQQQ